MLSPKTDIYLKNPIYPYFERDVKATLNNQSSFSGNFIANKNIEIFFNDFSLNWIKVYKEDLTEIAKEIYEFNQYDLCFDKYLQMFYFYLWVLNDLRIIGNSINPKSKKILNIGAGIGYLDILLYKALNPLNYCLVEIEQSSGQIDITGRKNNFSETIYPYQYLEKNIKQYKLNNLSLLTPERLDDKIKFDFVLSIRSWGFLYNIDTYIDYLKLVAHKQTLFISDIHKDFANDFLNNFVVIKVLNKYKMHNRILFSLRQ